MGRTTTPPTIRFWNHVAFTDDCWLWTAKTHKGYGKFAVARGRTARAHRWLYELVNGPLPKCLVLDHLCGVRNCVNLDHLEPITSGENTRRGLEQGGLAQRRHRARIRNRILAAATDAVTSDFSDAARIELREAVSDY